MKFKENDLVVCISSKHSYIVKEHEYIVFSIDEKGKRIYIQRDKYRNDKAWYPSEYFVLSSPKNYSHMPVWF